MTSKAEAMLEVVALIHVHEAQLAALEALSKPHNYCFNSSDDVTCDRGWGDCRPWNEATGRAQRELEQAIQRLTEAAKP